MEADGRPLAGAFRPELPAFLISAGERAIDSSGRLANLPSLNRYPPVILLVSLQNEPLSLIHRQVIATGDSTGVLQPFPI